MGRKNGITLLEVRKYLELVRTISELVGELQELEKKFFSIIPGDGYRLVGPYKVCHKIQRKRYTAWKQVCVERLGQTLVDELVSKAPLGKPSHSIEVKRRRTIEEVREAGKVPDHIPDEQVEDYVYKKLIKPFVDRKEN